MNKQMVYWYDMTEHQWHFVITEDGKVIEHQNSNAEDRPKVFSRMLFMNNPVTVVKKKMATKTNRYNEYYQN